MRTDRQHAAAGGPPGTGQIAGSTERAHAEWPLLPLEIAGPPATRGFRRAHTGWLDSRCCTEKSVALSQDCEQPARAQW